MGGHARDRSVRRLWPGCDSRVGQDGSVLLPWSGWGSARLLWPGQVGRAVLAGTGEQGGRGMGLGPEQWAGSTASTGQRGRACVQAEQGHRKQGRKGTSRQRWQRIRDWLMQQIDEGVWRADERLPSVRAMARLFSVSVNTVQHALDALEAHAHVRAVPRVGYFVASVDARVGVPGADFSGVTVDVDQAVTDMLSCAANSAGVSLSSAVLHEALTPVKALNGILQTLAAQDDGSVLHAFVPPPGLWTLRQEIAGLMAQRGVACSADDILLTSGDTVALELALAAVAQSGATVAIETPTYYGILQTIERLGMRALPIRTSAPVGIDLVQLAEAIKAGRVDVIFLNPTLQNPRGFVMSAAARRKLATLAMSADIPVIEDDVFAELLPLAARPPAIKRHAMEQTLYCSSFSKTATPGYRVGWCVPGRYRENILAQMFSRNLSVSSLGQGVLAEFIRQGQYLAHCQQLQAAFLDTCRFMTGFVPAHFPVGTVYRPPPGGFIHWLALPVGTDMPALLKMAAARGCHVTDGSLFHADRRGGPSIRLCLGRPMSPDVVRALITLAECVHACLG